MWKVKDKKLQRKYSWQNYKKKTQFLDLKEKQLNLLRFYSLK